uniref:Globin domain-containing protein n=1 Tax=Monopterus albus TaxID=43700 RepID=A0A3Q3K8A4_MONAL
MLAVWVQAKRGVVLGHWNTLFTLSKVTPRFLIVFPWNQRYFAAFGNLSTAAAVMGGLEKAVKNLDDIKNTYKSLSVMHSEKLHVDPDNFRVYWPFRLHPDVQEAWHKFLSVVVSALGSTTEMA